VTLRVSYLPQEVPVHAVLTAFEAILLAKQHSFSWRVGESDLALVERTLRDLDIEHLAMRYLNELSGGQRQLVSIAQALIRRAEVLLLDEPTSNLDLQRQLEVLELVRRVAEERSMTTVITMHDLNLASRFAAHVIVLNSGRVYAAGTPEAVLTPAMLRDVYGVHASVHPDADGVPQVNAIASLRQREESVYQPV
jgi:iron complex transport system ATP-binding protein